MRKRIFVIAIFFITIFICSDACSDKLHSKIERASNLYKEKKYPQAIELLQEVLQGEAENIDALMLLQAAFNKTGEFEQSIAHGKAILSIAPDNQTAHRRLAYTYRILDQYENAISSYESLLALSPENMKVNGQLGTILAEQGNYEEAIEPLTKALRLKGDAYNLFLILGICNLRLQRYEQAIEAFERFIKTEKTPQFSDRARLNIGDVYYTMGDYEKAIEQYAMITQDQSTYRLAQHYIKALNEVPEDAQRTVVNGVPFSSWNYNLKILGYCGSATLKMALNFLNDPVSRRSIAEKVEDDDDGAPLYNLWTFAVEIGFQAYLGVADISYLKYWINQGYPVIAAILDPESGGRHVTLVVGYDEIKDIIILHDSNHWIEERAISTAEFQQVWRYDDRISLFIFPAGVDLPHNFEANIYAQSCLHASKGWYYYIKNKQHDALMELEASVSNQPPLPGTYALLAKLYANDPTKNAKANHYLSSALTIGSSNGYTLLEAGLFYQTRNEYTKAVSMFKKGLELYPNAYYMRKKLASVYIELRDYVNAVIELEKLKTQCDQDPYCNDLSIHSDLLESYVSLGDQDSASESLLLLLSNMDSEWKDFLKEVDLENVIITNHGDSIRFNITKVSRGKITDAGRDTTIH